MARYRCMIDRTVPDVLAKLSGLQVPAGCVLVLFMAKETGPWRWDVYAVDYEALASFSGKTAAELRAQLQLSGGSGMYAIVDEPGVATFFQLVTFHLPQRGAQA